jgi:hypothetical protein
MPQPGYANPIQGIFAVNDLSRFEDDRDRSSQALGVKPLGNQDVRGLPASLAAILQLEP